MPRTPRSLLLIVAMTPIPSCAGPGPVTTSTPQGSPATPVSPEEESPLGTEPRPLRQSPNWEELDRLCREETTMRIDGTGAPSPTGSWMAFRALGASATDLDRAREASFSAARALAGRARESDVTSLTESVARMTQGSTGSHEYHDFVSKVLVASADMQVETEERRWEYQEIARGRFQAVAEVRAPWERVFPESAIRHLAESDSTSEAKARVLGLMAASARASQNERVELAALFARAKLHPDHTTLGELAGRLETLRGADEALGLLELQRGTDPEWAEIQIDVLLDRQLGFPELRYRLLRAVDKGQETPTALQVAASRSQLREGQTQRIEVFADADLPYACLWLDDSGLFLPEAPYRGVTSAEGKSALDIAHGGTRGDIDLIVLVGESSDPTLLPDWRDDSIAARDCLAATSESLSHRRQLRTFVQSIETALESGAIAATRVRWKQE